MNPSERKIIGKIPGMLIERPNSEKQGYIENLSAKTKPELQELLERQEKLLNNKSFISKLPDKGAKIRQFHDKIIKELKSKDAVDQACNMLSTLDISKKYVLEDLEWGKKHVDYAYVDSDDEVDEKDPIKVLAQSGPSKKIVKQIPSEAPLITKDDIKDIEEIKEAVLEEPHVKYLIDKDENCTRVFKNQFKPYKSTVSDVHNPYKEALRKRGLYWENTAATPPPSVHGPAKTLTLQESLAMLLQQKEQWELVLMQHSQDRLKEQMGRMSGPNDSLPINHGSYRTALANDTDDEDESAPEIDNESDNEGLDDEDKSGTMTFTVSEYITAKSLEEA